jgi:hypothetical protein
VTLSSIAEQIQALSELSAMDAAVKALNESLVTERATLEGLRSQLAQFQSALDKEQGTLAAAERARGEFQIELRNMQQQIEHSREKHSRSRTERETNAAEREMDELRKLVRDREDDVQKLGAEADQARAQVETLEAQAAKVREQLAACQGDIESKVAMLETQVASTGGGRDSIVARLPAQLYRRYEAVRQKRGSGATFTTDGTCKACNMALPPQMYHRLRREPLIEQCQSCNRVIYFVAPAPVAPPEGTSGT